MPRSGSAHREPTPIDCTHTTMATHTTLKPRAAGKNTANIAVNQGGGGLFSPNVISFPTGANPVAMASCDFDGSGGYDMAVVCKVGCL